MCKLHKKKTNQFHKIWSQKFIFCVAAQIFWKFQVELAEFQSLFVQSFVWPVLILCGHLQFTHNFCATIQKTLFKNIWCNSRKSTAACVAAVLFFYIYGLVSKAQDNRNSQILKISYSLQKKKYIFVYLLFIFHVKEKKRGDIRSLRKIYSQ